MSKNRELDGKKNKQGIMGLLSIIRKQKLKDKELRILMLGLDNAGKSTIIKTILHQDINKVIPTMGFEINTVAFEGFQLNIWDIGGQQTLRSFWFNYFDRLDALIWVIDLSNLQRLNENFKEMRKVLNNEKLIGLKILIYLNKMDLVANEEIPKVKEQVTRVLELDQIESDKWRIFESSAHDVDSVAKGLKWIVLG